MRFAASAFVSPLLVRTRISLVGIGRQPYLKIVKHLAAPSQAPLEVFIEAFEPNDLLFFTLIGHAKSTRAVPAQTKKKYNCS